MENLYTNQLCRDLGEHMTHKQGMILACEKSGDIGLLGRAKKMEVCGRQVSFAVTSSGEVVLDAALFCRQRLCPVCQWRRSLRAYSIVNAAVGWLGDGYSYQMLTLSRPNVKYECLTDEITSLNKSTSLLFRNDRIKQSIHGYYRALEVTYNPDRDDYHPHFHIITAVRPSYYHSRYFIKRDDMVQLWNSINGHDRDSAGHDLMVDWRRVRNLQHDVSEVAKYCVKPYSGYAADFNSWDIAIKQAKMINDCLSGRRLVQTGGVIRDAIRATSSIREAENLDGNLCDQTDDDIIYRLNYRFSDGEYILQES